MRKLDIEKIKLQIDESEEAFAKDINISLDELRLRFSQRTLDSYPHQQCH